MGGGAVERRAGHPVCRGAVEGGAGGAVRGGALGAGRGVPGGGAAAEGPAVGRGAGVGREAGAASGRRAGVPPGGVSAAPSRRLRPLPPAAPGTTGRAPVSLLSAGPRRL
ncbi:hypothetical protein DUI70_2103 [Streptomyces albus]|nr:hypothetical protein DUI70_2103 [Streptomyces albus]